MWPRPFESIQFLQIPLPREEQRFQSPLLVMKTITRVGFKGKTIIDFNQFEKFSTKNVSLKKYIDRYRYYFLIDCKINRDLVNFKKLKENLTLSNLTMATNRGVYDV